MKRSSASQRRLFATDGATASAGSGPQVATDFRLQPRNPGLSQRPSVGTSPRGRKRRPGLLQPQLPPPSLATTMVSLETPAHPPLPLHREEQAPVKMISFVPSTMSVHPPQPEVQPLFDGSIVSPSNTPAQKPKSTKPPFYLAQHPPQRVPPFSLHDTTAAPGNNHNNSVQCSPGGNLNGALRGLALHSPRPNPSLPFSHQNKSSPFSISGRPTYHPTSNLLSPQDQGHHHHQDSSFSRSLLSEPMESPQLCSPPGLMNVSNSTPTPPPKTAPLRLVNPPVTLTDRKRAPSPKDFKATKSPKLSEPSNPSLLHETPVARMLWNGSLNLTPRSSTNDSVLLASPSPRHAHHHTPLPSIGLAPRSDGSRRTELRRPRDPPISHTNLTQSDVSFIPLPEWGNTDEDGGEEDRQVSSPPDSMTNGLHVPRVQAVSLLHPPSSNESRRNDPIEQMFAPYETPGDQVLDTESLSHNEDDEDDDGTFLLVAPRDIEEEASMRPSKRRSSGHEAADSLSNLPNLPRTTSTGAVSTRDLVTPPAMAQGSSPPPLPPPGDLKFH